MADPEDANYTCSLTPASVEKAKRELFEDPKQRLGAVQTLRQWIRDQPHLTSRSDTLYLLAVLRTAKFSQLRAREIIETMLTMKAKFPQLLTNIDSYDPVILTAVERGVIVPLPKPDRQGRGVLISRPGAMDLSDSKFTTAKEMTLNVILALLLKETNENMLVNGEILIFDMTGFSAKHVARSTMEKNAKEHYKILQECSLGRMKGLHFYNAGTFFEIATSLMKPFLKKKFVDRMHVHNTMESLYEEVPMDCWPNEYLPDDYTGPSAGSLQSIVGGLKQKLLDPGFHGRLLDYTSERYKIDLSKKPADNTQQKASFRKLADD